MVWIVGYGSFSYSMGIGLAIVQIILWVWTGLMIRRLLERLTNIQFSFSVAALYLCSFPMFFVIVTDRQILSTFTLVAFVYYRYANRDLKSSGDFVPVDYLWSLAAIGTTLTSVLASGFELLKSNRSFGLFLRDSFQYGVICLLTFLLLAPQHALNLAGVRECFQWTHLNSETPKETYRVRQYLHFVESNVFFPASQISKEEISAKSPTEVPVSYLLTGCILFALAVTGGVLYRKEPVVQMMSVWVLLSLILLLGLGYGARFNEMQLLIPYFSWAFVPLIMLPFHYFLKNYGNLVAIGILLCALFTLAQNLYYVAELTRVTTGFYVIPQ